MKQALAGQLITLQVNATQGCFEVMQSDMLIKQLPIKMLGGICWPPSI